MFGSSSTAPAEQVVTGAALAINDRATAAMYMLAAARECLTDSDGESLVLDRFDYEAALEAAARRVGEQMHRRGGLRVAKVSDVIEAALNTMRESIPAEGSESILDAADVHDLAVCTAVEFWSIADAVDCARIAAVVSQPVPEPGELAPAAFAELVLHAGSASGWEGLSEEERNEVLDSDGNLGGCRWSEVHATLDSLPHAELGLTRGATMVPSYVAPDVPGDETAPVSVDSPVSDLSGMSPGLELVIDEVIDEALYETRIPTSPGKSATRVRVNPAAYRNDAATEVLLHLLIAGDAATQHPAALPADSDDYTIMGALPSARRRSEALAASAQLALEAHILLYRSGGRARAAGRAAVTRTEPESTQLVPQLIMEVCLAAGFAWRWMSRILACWDDTAARAGVLSSTGHRLTGAVSDEARLCFAGFVGDDHDQVEGSTVVALARVVAEGAAEVSQNNIKGLRALYGVTATGPARNNNRARNKARRRRRKR